MFWALKVTRNCIAHLRKENVHLGASHWGLGSVTSAFSSLRGDVASTGKGRGVIIHGSTTAQAIHKGHNQPKNKEKKKVTNIFSLIGDRHVLTCQTLYDIIKEQQKRKVKRVYNNYNNNAKLKKSKYKSPIKIEIVLQRHNYVLLHLNNLSINKKKTV